VVSRERRHVEQRASVDGTCLAREVEDGLALLGHEAVDVDERGDIGVAERRATDERTTVGVADQDDGALGAGLEERLEVLRVCTEGAEGVREVDDGISVGAQFLAHGVERAGVAPRAVHHDDGRLRRVHRLLARRSGGDGLGSAAGEGDEGQRRRGEDAADASTLGRAESREDIHDGLLSWGGDTGCGPVGPRSEAGAFVVDELVTLQRSLWGLEAESATPASTSRRAAMTAVAREVMVSDKFRFIS
jgi:hypothetical protein